MMSSKERESHKNISVLESTRYRRIFAALLSTLIHGAVLGKDSATHVYERAQEAMSSMVSSMQKEAAEATSEAEKLLRKKILEIRHREEYRKKIAEFTTLFLENQAHEISLTDFFTFVETYVDDSGISSAEFEDGKTQFQSIVSLAQSLKQADIDRDAILNIILSHQGEHIEDQPSLFRLANKKGGNCEARARFLSSVITEVWPELSRDRKIIIQLFEGHQRVAIDEGEKFLIVEGRQVTEDIRDPRIPTFEAHDLYVGSTLKTLGVENVTIPSYFTDQTSSEATNKVSSQSELNSGDNSQEAVRTGSGILYPASSVPYQAGQESKQPWEPYIADARNKNLNRRFFFESSTESIVTDEGYAKYVEELRLYNRIIARAQETVDMFMDKYNEQGAIVEHKTNGTVIYQVPFALAQSADYPLLLDALTVLGQNEESPFIFSLEVTDLKNIGEKVTGGELFPNFNFFNGAFTISSETASTRVRFAKHTSVENIQKILAYNHGPEQLVFDRYADLLETKHLLSVYSIEGDILYLPEYDIQHMNSEELVDFADRMLTLGNRAKEEFMNVPLIRVHIDDPVMTLPPTVWSADITSPSIAAAALEDSSVISMPMHLFLDTAPKDLTVKNTSLTLTIRDGVLKTGMLNLQLRVQDSFSARHVSRIQTDFMQIETKNVVRIYFDNQSNDQETVVIEAGAFQNTHISQLQFFLEKEKIDINPEAFDNSKIVWILFYIRDNSQFEALEKILPTLHLPENTQVQIYQEINSNEIVYIWDPVLKILKEYQF